MKVLDVTTVLAQDLRYRTRALMKDRALSAIVVLILACGIGATTTMFSLVRAVMLEPLPFLDPGGLVRLWESSPGRGVTQGPVSVPNFRDWQEQQSVFEQMAASEMTTFNLTGAGDPERIAAARITANLAPTLGIRPVLGRSFLRDDERPGANRVVLLGYGLWQRRFGADPSLLRRTIQLNGEGYSVAGVMPAGFDFPGGRELWVPLVLDPAREPWRADRTNRNLAVFARLMSGVSVAQASTGMEVVARRLESSYPETNAGWGVRVVTFYDWMVPEPMRRAAMALLGAVGLLLLLACANVANLLLARSVARQRELATHAALGASRARLVRQLLLDSLLLAGFAGVLGVALSVWGTRLISSATMPDMARLQHVAVDDRVLAFAFVLSLSTGILFGVVPAWSASRSNLADRLKNAGASGGSRRTQRAGGMLVAAQVGLTVAVLVCAALLVRSFLEIRRLPLGFATDGILTFQVNLPQAKYGKPELRVDFYHRWLDRLRALPGVTAAGATTHPPYSPSEWKLEVVLEGSQSACGERALAAEARAVTPGYFATVGIPLKRGRTFVEQDRQAIDPPLIVSEAFVRRCWPGVDPIGRRFRPGPGSRFGTVVGVVADVRSGTQEDPQPALYFPYSYIGMSSLAVAVRANVAPEALIPLVRSGLRALDAEQPIYNIRTVDQIVANATAQPRFQAVVVTFVATTALILAAFGTYSLVTYIVRQRRHEIAMRIAFGARRADVLSLLVRQCMRYVVPGVVLGLAGSLVAALFVRSLLFRVSPTDTLTFTIVPLMLVAVAFAACVVPARRAARMDPLTMLRRE